MIFAWGTSTPYETPHLSRQIEVRPFTPPPFQFFSFHVGFKNSPHFLGDLPEDASAFWLYLLSRLFTRRSRACGGSRLRTPKSPLPFRPAYNSWWRFCCTKSIVLPFASFMANSTHGSRPTPLFLEAVLPSWLIFFLHCTSVLLPPKFPSRAHRSNVTVPPFSSPFFLLLSY